MYKKDSITDKACWMFITMAILSVVQRYSFFSFPLYSFISFPLFLLFYKNYFSLFPDFRVLKIGDTSRFKYEQLEWMN